MQQKKRANAGVSKTGIDAVGWLTAYVAALFSELKTTLHARL